MIFLIVMASDLYKLRFYCFLNDMTPRPRDPLGRISQSVCVCGGRRVKVDIRGWKKAAQGKCPVVKRESNDWEKRKKKLLNEGGHVLNATLTTEVKLHLFIGTVLWISSLLYIIARSMVVLAFGSDKKNSWVIHLLEISRFTIVLSLFLSLSSSPYLYFRFFRPIINYFNHFRLISNWWDLASGHHFSTRCHVIFFRASASISRLSRRLSFLNLTTAAI